MLHSLYIENFAIVDQLTLSLNTGLTIISGETGAGKSILIDALGLVLGERADTTAVHQGCESARVDATFLLPPSARTWLQQQGISDQYTCQIQRIVTQNGRSRAMINEQPVSLQILRKLGDYLVDIHGQHAHQSLLKHDVQRQLLDETIENDLLTQVYQAYQHWKVLQTELNYLGGNTQDREARVALLHYQVQELEALELTSDSIQQLEEEHRRLANVTKLLENSQHALTLLDAEEANSTLSYLTQASHALQEAQQHDEQLGGVTALLDNAMVQTQEAVSELRHYLRRLEIDPARLQWVEQRITKLHDIARKHKVHFSDLPDYFERLSTQLAELQNYEQRAEQLSIEVAQALKDYQQIAERLHDQRLIAAQRLSTRISENIQRLGMSVGQVVITVTADEHASPTATGMDIVEFLVSTNPGHSPKPLHKIASGGELSRISLAIQVITAQNSGTPTLIFDEVDVGIGGAVAETVGQLLNQLGQQRQVLCITHLPQVACQGDHHLQVNKTIQQQATHTDIKPLNEQERVEEIARMLGGLEITPQTLVYAREMLQRRKQA
jgi:DNA repair protein RecN (Recombination protein N)